MNILIAPNSYKECADSVKISKIISEKLQLNTTYNIVSKPLSDGGDGFLNVCNSIFEVKPLTIYITNDYGDNIIGYQLLYCRNEKTILIESAELFGLKKVVNIEKSPLDHSSEVLGKIILKLAKEVKNNRLLIEKLWIGVGGTATIDLGLGACSQLGVILNNEMGDLIKPAPKNFNQIRKIEIVEKNLPFKIMCVVDVDTPLISEPGAIEIFGLQKGASEDDLRIIKRGIKNILNILNYDKKLDIPNKLNGAGGGLAAGLKIFFGAEIISAETFIKSYLLKDINIDSIDAVITGEGSFDTQSFEGKGTGVILDLFKDKSIPIFLINGSTNLPDSIELSKNINIINIIDFFNSREESMRDFQSGIAKATQIIIDYLRK